MFEVHLDEMIDQEKYFDDSYAELNFADVVAINKFDKRGALDALRDVRKQYKRNHNLWDAEDESLPVIGTIASQFNDPGTNQLYVKLIARLAEKTGSPLTSSFVITDEMSEKIFIIPPHRTRYPSEISENNRKYDQWVAQQATLADKLYRVQGALMELEAATQNTDIELAAAQLRTTYDRLKLDFDPRNWEIIQSWENKRKLYKDPEYSFQVLISEWTPLNGAVGDIATAAVQWPISGDITKTT
jgi:methylmalonyl-CoA mutase